MNTHSGTQDKSASELNVNSFKKKRHRVLSVGSAFAFDAICLEKLGNKESYKSR
jgi:hypothetical protein